MLSKRTLSIAVLFFLLLPFFSEETVSVSKIRIIIEDAEYSWEKGGSIIPAGEETSYISPHTVISYTSLKPGNLYSLKQLDEETARTQIRLTNSGLFYTASVQIVPPRKNPQERTIVITVKEGFYQRFSGGNAYGMYGREGLGGSRSGIYAYAGWNRLGVSYAHENLFNNGTILAASFASYNFFPSLLMETEYNHSIASSLHFGKYITPDIGVTLFSRILFTSLMSSFSEAHFSLGPVIRLYRYEFWPFSFSWNMETSALWYMNQNSYTAQTSWSFHKNFAEQYFIDKGRDQKLTLAFLLSAGFENSTAPESLAFNLYSTVDRSVRSGYSEEEVSGISYALFSTELRFNVFSLRIPPAFTCVPQIFLYTDIAFIEQKGSDGLYSFRDAFGGGIRLLLDNPIFAYFTFAYGLNHEGSSRFVFAVTGGF
ncbi:MAG TPA: POTRA domain-containing protein [Treponemataceae bacterium]|nr:POTRA domain-containing protein [Treponemataceae bacterium]